MNYGEFKIFVRKLAELIGHPMLIGDTQCYHENEESEEKCFKCNPFQKQQFADVPNPERLRAEENVVVDVPKPKRLNLEEDPSKWSAPEPQPDLMPTPSPENEDKNSIGLMNPTRG